MKKKASGVIVLLTVVGFLGFGVTACKKAARPIPPNIVESSDEIKQERLLWNLKTLVDAYEHGGHTDPAWDDFAKQSLTEFARIRANQLDPNEAWWDLVATNAEAAVKVGCTDPMVKYLFIKFALPQTNKPNTFADAFCQTALDMQNSSYPSIRKFYAAAAAVDQMCFTYGTNVGAQSVFAQVLPLMNQNLTPALRDKTMPPEEALDAAQRALTLMSGNNAQYLKEYQLVEKPLFDNWPNASATWLFKGNSYVDMAWRARGGGYADKVNDQGWKTFFADLAIAENALTNAWSVNTNDERIAIQMLRVAEGAQRNRDEMELWFQRAMADDPNCYEACQKKLHYLYPQWYGSRDDMIAFGHECVGSTNWGGSVPLILTDAHWEYWLYINDPQEKTNYWRLPDVWPDIKASYARFFQLNPQAAGYYKNYAWFAYNCEQWDIFNGLVPKVRAGDYYYFGGKDEFDKMVQGAREKSGNSKSL